jgi:hypothetical protein
MPGIVEKISSERPKEMAATKKRITELHQRKATEMKKMDGEINNLTAKAASLAASDAHNVGQGIYPDTVRASGIIAAHKADSALPTGVDRFKQADTDTGTDTTPTKGSSDAEQT